MEMPNQEHSVKSVALSKNHFQKLMDWVKSSEEEICGFLFGYEKAAFKYVEELCLVSNAVPFNKRHRFQISSEDYLKAEKYCLSSSFQLLGIFHSHIGVSANPSSTDIQNAFPGILYLIVSTLGKSQFEIKTWELQPSIKLVKTIIN
jgi:proteasome lid subunit RPN8/RPN11